MVIEPPPDFKEFLKLLNSHEDEHLVTGGFAVGFHVYPRATSHIDIGIRKTPDNVGRVVDAIREFGFDTPNLTPELLLQQRKIVRMGHPPVRIEVMHEIDGVTFEECRTGRVRAECEGIAVPFIGLQDLRRNKTAGGRPKDLDDLRQLP